jgi:hypothetical protein
MDRIDGVFRSERLRVTSRVEAAAAAMFATLYRDPEETVGRVVPVVEAGAGRVVALTDAYMTAKAVAAGVRMAVKGLSAFAYRDLRSRDAAEVYQRPFGALGGQLAQGAELEVALRSARGALSRLVRTDMQLAQTHAAQEWMVDEPRVVGYERVLGPGDNCPLCMAASTRRYYREDLMPIHERCACTVAPVFGDPGALSRPSAAVRVADDAEIGPRLLDEAWAA